MLRKLFYVVLGLAVIAGAVLTLGYRAGNDPSHWGHDTVRRLEGKSTSVTSASRTRALSSPKPSGSSQSSSPLASMSTIIDVLNILVGVVGIWLALHGIRVQKQAMAAMDERSRR